MDISRGVSAHPPWVVHGEPFLQRSLVFATFVGAPGIVYASRFRRPRFGPKVLRLGALLGKVAGPEKCNIVGHTLRQKVQLPFAQKTRGPIGNMSLRGPMGSGQGRVG